ncbi:MAG: amidohydrolase family protein [Bryobacteraceae bacterium]
MSLRRVLVALALAAAPWTASAATFAISGATVVDGTGAKPRVANVVVRSGRIAEVGGEIPPGISVINGAGQTLTPGFFDVHTHLPYSGMSGLWGDWAKNLKAYLYCGVTSVVDFGSYPEMFEPMRRLLREGVVTGPRIHMAARMTSPGGHGAEGGRGDLFSLEVLTPAEARAGVRQWLAYKPDAIKVFTDGWRYGFDEDMTGMHEDTLRAIVEEAHKAGVEVLTHTVTLQKAKEAARAGVDVIAHGVGDATVDSDLIAIMREKGAAYAPTLAVYEAKNGPYPPMQKLLMEPAMLAGLPAVRKTRETPARTRRWEHLVENVALLRTAGIPVATGTDAGVSGMPHGWASLHEMELFAASGMSPLEAITAATGVAAKAIGVDRDRGTIEPGKLADLVLIAGAPHERIADLEKVSRVFLGGDEVDREALRAAIARPAVTPLPAHRVGPLIDDMEAGRTSLDTLRVNATDSGNDHSRMLFQRVLRPAGGHAMAVQARMGQKRSPFAQLWIPLSKGGVEPVDASAYSALEFEVRGEGAYRVLFLQRSVRDGKFTDAPFAAGAEWGKVRVALPAIRDDLLVLAFEIARPAGADGWLELDNLRFY